MPMKKMLFVIVACLCWSSFGLASERGSYLYADISGALDKQMLKLNESVGMALIGEDGAESSVTEFERRQVAIQLKAYLRNLNEQLARIEYLFKKEANVTCLKKVNDVRATDFRQAQSMLARLEEATVEDQKELRQRTLDIVAADGIGYAFALFNQEVMVGCLLE